MNTVSENMETFKITINWLYPSGIMRYLVLVTLMVILKAPEHMTDSLHFHQEGQGLLTVPHISPCDYTRVYIPYNSVTSLTTPILTECHDLEGIYMSSNSITTVNKEAFTAIKDTLKFLSFQDNNLQSVGDEFSELTSLLYLKLSDNNLIGGIQEDAFCNTQMHWLYLKRCGLTQFPRVHVKCLNETLLSLFLNENSITELHAEDVEGLVNLVTFELTDNLFTHIDASSFGALISLEWLIMNQTTYDKTTLADLEDDLSTGEYYSVFVCSCQHIWLVQNNIFVSNAGQGFAPVHTYPCIEAEASTPRTVDVPRDEMLTCHSITVSAISKVGCARECQRNDEHVCTAFSYDKTTAVCEVWRTLNRTPDTADIRNMHCIETNGKMECSSGG